MNMTLFYSSLTAKEKEWLRYEMQKDAHERASWTLWELMTQTEMSARLYNCLYLHFKSDGIKRVTVRDVDPDDLVYKIRNFGKSCAAEFKTLRGF